MTFSIVARDAETGALGIATATAGPVVGSLVPHGRAGVGAIATQAMTNPYLGFDGLDALQNDGAEPVLAKLLSSDGAPQKRQIILVDRTGATAGWTGLECGPFAGHRLYEGMAVAGNILAGEQVLDAMAEGFMAPGALADRLLAALEAGHAAGGDSRGAGSAALKIYTTEAYPAVDLRADLAPEPIAVLATLLKATRHDDYARFFDDVPRRHLSR